MDSQLATTKPNIVAENINNAMVDVQSMWNIPGKHIQSVQRAVALTNTKHGMLSGVPILCKDVECPYLKTCMIPPADRIIGSRCPQEIGTLLARFEQLCHEFKITEEDAVDLGQVKELVDLEVMMLRCDNKMAIDANFIDRTVKDIARNGSILYEDAISQATQLKLMLIDKHSRILKDLNGTRSAKKDQTVVFDASREAASLIAKAKQLDISLSTMQIEVVDEDFVEADYTEEYEEDTAEDILDEEFVEVE